MGELEYFSGYIVVFCNRRQKKYLKQLFKQQKNISEVKRRILFFKRFIEICENNTFITNDELEYLKKELIFIRLNR